MPKIIGVIPARFASSRLPGKVLADIGGKPLIQHTYENALQSKFLEEILVAVDDPRVEEAVLAFGGTPIMTDPALPSGSDRVAATVRDMDCDIVVNIQGDEPFLPVHIVDQAIQLLLDDPELPIGTVCREIFTEEELNDPGVVKVALAPDGRGLYFSRSIIPYPRNNKDFHAYEHIGVYVFRKDFLLQYVEWEPTPLERAESLEMLRILEHGYPIKVAVTASEDYGFSIDTPDDLEKAREYYAEKHQ
ncbi:MAG TPA: 3-deoxy-manno-octulosonate cytidylyltransferase [Candidatus Lokiarchaeia archaeon]|nr:3-deoxy-manno-octulosonate cytidylyltransferase [Candidatus Lokiarchaeia archaeon]